MRSRSRAARFIAAISYNLYIWHQWLAVRIKYDLRIPPWQGDTPPNQLGDTVWMHRYLALIWCAAFAAAVLATYLVEKPAARWLKSLLLSRMPQNGGKEQEPCTSGACKAKKDVL